MSPKSQIAPNATALYHPFHLCQLTAHAQVLAFLYLGVVLVCVPLKKLQIFRNIYFAIVSVAGAKNCANAAL